MAVEDVKAFDNDESRAKAVAIDVGDIDVVVEKGDVDKNDEEKDDEAGASLNRLRVVLIMDCCGCC